MAQDVGHLIEAGAMVEHLGRSGMPKDMTCHAGACDEARMLERLPDYSPDRAVGQRLKRRPAAEEDLTTVTARASILEVSHHGVADVLREGLATGPASFPGTQFEPPIGPIDVVEAEHDHILSA